MLKMKTLGLLLVIVYCSFAQNMAFKDVELKINSISKSAVYFVFNYTTKLDRSKILRGFRDNQNSFQLIDAEEEKSLFSGTYKNLTMLDSALTFEVVIKKPKLLEEVFTKQKPVYLKVMEDFVIYNKENSDSLTVTPGFIEEKSLQIATFSERQLELLGGALDSNYIATKSSVDFARDINADDSTKSEYSLRFNLAGKLARIFDVPFYFKLTGRVSTEKTNPLNQIESYLALGVSQHFSLDAGIVSNQTFKQYAYRVNANFETLLPNFINLSFGHNRLRLKPYLNLGFSMHKNVQEIAVFKNKDPKFLITGNFYYPIPIGKKYTFIYYADATWSNSFVKDKFIFNYQASLVYDTPLEDLKVLLKAESGKKLFYTQKDTKLLLGMLLDITNI